MKEVIRFPRRKRNRYMGKRMAIGAIPQKPTLKESLQSFAFKAQRTGKKFRKAQKWMQANINIPDWEKY